MKSYQTIQHLLSVPIYMLTLFFASHAPAQVVGTSLRYVHSAVVNLRSEPNATSMNIVKLPINTQLLITETKDNFCRVSLYHHPKTMGFVVCTGIAQEPVSEKELEDEFARWRVIYKLALDAKFQSANGDDPKPQSEAREKFLADPRTFLSLLEKRFYLYPNTSTLAWYGTVAEDVAYLSFMNSEEYKRGEKLKFTLPWLSPVKATWKNMQAYLEGGWQQGEKWPADGVFAYNMQYPMFLGAYSKSGKNEEFSDLIAPWLPKTPASLFQQDGDALFFGGEPGMPKENKRMNAKASADNIYLSWQSALSLVKAKDYYPPMSAAGNGFRNIRPEYEFLKNQSTPIDINFIQTTDRYGIEGLLGTTNVILKMPRTAYTYAVTKGGLVRASALEIGGAIAWCSDAANVKISFASPLKNPPLAFLTTLAPIAADKMKIKPLGERQFKGELEFNGLVELNQEELRRRQTGIQANLPLDTFRLRGFHVDLDGDGIPDMLIAHIELPRNNGLDANGNETDPQTYFLVYANIGGAWKMVAQSIACGGC